MVAVATPPTTPSRGESRSPGATWSKTLLAIRCTTPGRVVPITKICVDERVRLGEILGGWAIGVMKAEAAKLPAEAKVTGAGGSALDLDAPLQALRRLLPVREGRPTVTVDWPAEPVAPTPPAGSAQKRLSKGSTPKAGSPASLASKTKAAANGKKPETPKSKVPVKKANVKDAKKDKAQKAKKDAKQKKKKAKGKENRAQKKASSSSSSSSSDSSSDGESDNGGALDRFLADSSDEEKATAKAEQKKGGPEEKKS